MAKTTGISPSSVQRIWRAHHLQPHRIRTFKRSRDPSFAAKLTDIVGLYVDPPAHAVVLSGALAAIMNAVVDALAPLGIAHVDMPATPEKGRAIRAKRGG